MQYLVSDLYFLLLCLNLFSNIKQHEIISGHHFLYLYSGCQKSVNFAHPKHYFYSDFWFLQHRRQSVATKIVYDVAKTDLFFAVLYVTPSL